MTATVAQCLRSAIKLQAFSDSPRIDCEVLLSHVLKKERTWLYTWPEYELSVTEFDAFTALFERRLLGEPVAYIIGEREFWSLSLEVNNSTLIPRPDTEILVETALDLLGETTACQFLDLGTGTGAIALAIAKEKSQWLGVGVDQSEAAIALARRNAQRLNINNTEWICSDWFAQLAGKKFDLIVSNPPYIDKNDIHLSQGDVRFEPLSALVANNEGFADLEFIISQAPNYLENNGWLILEHGFQQADIVKQLLSNAGFDKIKTYTDLGGNDRVSVGRYSRLI